MTGSDRLSARVADEFASLHVRSRQLTDSGADGGSPPGASHRRVGRRQLLRLSTSLSDRDRAILGSLAGLHYLTTRQIERLHFAGSMTPLAAARGARQVLARLYALGVVERLERRVGGVRAGSASYVLKLSPTGHRLLDTGSRRRSREPSLSHLDHVLAVAEVVVQLHGHARRHVDVEVIAVEGEPDCWRWYVAEHGRKALLKPDLRLTIGIGERELHWFVELDRGTEHRPALARKLSVYVGAWRDGGEQTRAGVFPRVLWIVPDDERRQVIAQVIASLSGVPDGMFVTSTNASAIRALVATDGGRP